MTEYRAVTTDADWRIISKLYKKAFPLMERKPLWLMRSKERQGKADAWIIEEDGCFVGFAITMNSGDLVMLDYFAVAEDARGKGYGSDGLKWLQEKYKDYRFFLEIESTHVKASNMEQRLGRKAFYEKNGMSEAGVSARVFGVEFDCLGYDCKVGFEEYRKLYRACYGRLVGWNVKPVKIRMKTEESI